MSLSTVPRTRPSFDSLFIPYSFLNNVYIARSFETISHLAVYFSLFVPICRKFLRFCYFTHPSFHRAQIHLEFFSLWLGHPSFVLKWILFLKKKANIKSSGPIFNSKEAPPPEGDVNNKPNQPQDDSCDEQTDLDDRFIVGCCSMLANLMIRLFPVDAHCWIRLAGCWTHRRRHNISIVDMTLDGWIVWWNPDNWVQVSCLFSFFWTRPDQLATKLFQHQCL